MLPSQHRVAISVLAMSMLFGLCELGSSLYWRFYSVEKHTSEGVSRSDAAPQAGKVGHAVLGNTALPRGKLRNPLLWTKPLWLVDNLLVTHTRPAHTDHSSAP
jgi:hypothetical protein